jgi:hypothetical protein
VDVWHIYRALQARAAKEVPSAGTREIAFNRMLFQV